MNTLQPAPLQRKRGSTTALESDIPKISRLEDKCHELHQTQPVPALSYQRSPPKPSPATPVASTQISVRSGMTLDAAEQQHLFPCVVAVQHPTVCDKKFPLLWQHNCPGKPSEENKHYWQRHYIIDDGAWMAFEDGKWKDVYLPMKVDDRGCREPIPHRNYRKIREAIFPRGLIGTVLLESRLPPPRLPHPAKAQYLWHAPVPVPGSAPDQDRPPPRTAALPGVKGLTSGLGPCTISAAVPDIGLTTRASQGSLYEANQRRRDDLGVYAM
ncbi:hypothetical protein FOQG_18336 [Fusarium oxysporum f. sp. raphani 54005]|uniref:Uncharacterized protein n=1 Tax=Fusarium oxysporum f. sp. raphani 54005 TaxID=1089458 RepID=X0B472_FUSOX|nr:hypothetical protein FOQG_18336 [Fusarium oxysporum f. sp. raphani 54005]KAJ4034147.1 hypothetical protein NW758_011105 [Fusarium oxysporum]KAK2692263.1 hypothetical protein QWA68_008231 [Fusarium oxysporum]